MKTKNLLLCLLLLVLGTTAAFADKYYSPADYRVEHTRYKNLADMVGQKVMIYNAGIKSGEDYTGFLYANGQGIAFDKCKERDRYVHNECYVFTVEGFDTNSDDNYDYYALKSLSTGTYIDFNGKLSVDAAPLYFGKYSECKSKFADKVEEYGYGTTLVGEITEGTAVFAVSDNNGKYWCGGKTTFESAASEAAPFAFYKVNEVTSGGYLQDLHIYSRCDVFSAQKIYGLAQSAAAISAYPAANGSLELLVDGEYSTSVTTASGAESGVSHYLQFALSNSVESMYIYLKRNANASNAPETILVQDASGTTLKTLDVKLNENEEYYSAKLEFDASVSEIRICASEPDTPISFSEVSVLPARDEVKAAFEYFKTPIPIKSTAAQYTEVVADNNKNNSDVKLLSGVPLAGNKYRIYADAYSADAYVNRDIRTNDGNGLVADESYLNAQESELDYFYWYCEQVPGGLAFKNVATGKYLTLDGTQDNVYTWTISTVLTHRHGVPLKNGSGEYLTVHNDGTSFETGVKSVFDQTATNTLIKGGDTADDATDDVTVAAGVCSDYVFLPIDRTAGEKKVTFTANELINRNSEFRWNGQKFTLPFSRIFADSDADPVLTLNCPETHKLDDFYIDGVASEADTENGDAYTFDVSHASVVDNSVVEIRFNFTTVEDFEDNGKFYYICNLQEQAAAQQARPQRTSINVGTGPTSQTATYSYYAAFDSKSTNMALVGNSGLDAASLFYFTSVKRSDDNDYDQAYINNVLTTAKCRAANEWTDGGALYYLQPNAVYDSDNDETYQGYSISRTKLNANNNPRDAWVASMGDDADVVTDDWAESASAAWAFVEVTEDDALKMINEYIVKFKEYSIGIIENYSGELVNEKKVTAYVTAIGLVSSESATSAAAMEQLRNLYSLSTKARYDILALPDITAEEDVTKVSPKWYYIRNVESEKFYAKYAGGKNYMSLIDGSADGSKKLANLFYIANADGEKVNANNVNEYLSVHIHNFMALQDSVLLGENTRMATGENIKRTNAVEPVVKVLGNVGILPTDAWRIAFEVKSDGTDLNDYGSCYLAATEENNVLGNNFTDGFQIYFRADNKLAVRVGFTNGYDDHQFDHLDGAYSSMKIVITYGGGNIKIEVTNDAGVTQVYEKACTFSKGITNLYAALPMTGVEISSITVDKVDAMKWAEHSSEKRNWYILPSSNVNYPGLAIVMNGADDNNLGWTNYRSEDNTVFIDAGNADYSSWQFEKVKDFDDHLEELLDMYNMENVVIYNKELVELYNIIEKNKAIITDEFEGDGEEAAFNEIYEKFKNYTGPAPEELKAPKPGKFYTVHHVPASMPNDFMVSDRNVVKVGEDTNTADGYISRGVWYFNGTEEGDGFYALDGSLKLMSLHTLSFPYADGFTADSMKLSDNADAAAVAIEKVGAANVRLKVNGNYLSTNGDYIAANADALDTPNYIGTTFSHESGANAKAISVRYDNVAVSTALAATSNGSDITAFKTGGSIASSVLCPNVNGDTDPTLIFTLTYTGLPAGAEYDNVALDVHAFNGDGEYHSDTDAKADGKNRQWTVAVQQKDGENYVDRGSLANFEVVQGIYRHKVWDVQLTDKAVADADGNLTIRLVVTKGAANAGCFFGLSGVALSTAGEAHDQWYIEEVADPERIYHSVTTASAGHATLMLGFPALIPSEVEAFRGVKHGPMGNVQYFSMVSYGEPGETRILPANTPVVVRNTDASATEKNVKFFYRESDAERENDNYIRGSLYYKVVNARAHDNTSPIESDLDGEDVNIYMLQTNKGTSKFYWIYEEASSDGTIASGNANTDNGGYVVCNANKAYVILPAASTSVTSYSLRFLNSGTTDIEDVFENEDTGGAELVETIYDLQGRRLSEITTPGIYIVNGKKVLVK